MTEIELVATKIREEFGASDGKRDAGLTTPSDIQRFDNICYGKDPVWQSLDLYRPKSMDGKKLPVIVSVSPDIVQRNAPYVPFAALAVMGISVRIKDNIAIIPIKRFIVYSFRCYQFSNIITLLGSEINISPIFN